MSELNDLLRVDTALMGPLRSTAITLLSPSTAGVFQDTENVVIVISSSSGFIAEVEVLEGKDHEVSPLPTDNDSAIVIAPTEASIDGNSNLRKNSFLILVYNNCKTKGGYTYKPSQEVSS
jgi:hypothetical protein